MDDQGFTRFVTDEASVANGLVLLVTDDLDATGEIVEAAWPDVHRRWPVIAASRHPRANAFAPFVARAVRYAEANAPAPATSGGTLELRDDVVMDVASFGGRPERVPSRGSTAAEDEADPADRAVLQAFHDLAPRERALVALTVLAGLDEKELPWAVRWRPPRAALVAGRAVRDLMLTSAPLVVGQVADPSASTAMQARVVRVLKDEAARAAVDGSETAARVTAPLAGARQRRPLPHPGRGWLVAAAAVVVVLLAAFVVQLRDDAPASEAADPPPAPKAEAGYQLVGYRGVYTSVPSSWSHNQLECGQPVANTVIYPDASSGCFGGTPVTADVPPSSVTFSDLPTSAVPLGRLRRVNQVGDLGVYATTPVHREGLVHEIVLVPQANVQMIVRGTDIHVMDDIVDSLQRVPDGYAVVPPCQRLKLRVAIKQLDDAGLGVTLIQASTLSGREREPPVTRQTIASGTLVADGTSVGLGFPSTD